MKYISNGESKANKTRGRTIDFSARVDGEACGRGATARNETDFRDGRPKGDWGEPNPIGDGCCGRNWRGRCDWMKERWALAEMVVRDSEVGRKEAGEAIARGRERRGRGT